ncbi:hypothetical protein KDE13_05105 [Campylobacter sp. faydin G-140]|uniref:DUF5416 family protein n=1 Tax=Campylobacter anatolicus TaxID=2829105 RepID=UPI001B9171E4|nr:DUF5416 family protein [Campylobacter anatolicus]MBR8465736.1 hypothetical protein [Campylobacter anatolicus]
MVDSKNAYYDGCFSTYKILPTRSIENFVIIQNSEICDLVSDEIEQFIFADCTKNFYQISDIQRDVWSIDTDEIKIEDKIIKSIKIVIKGYNETNDNFKFDLDNLTLNVPYRYAITNDSFEMSIFLDTDRDSVVSFLSTLECDFDSKINSNKNIIIYINDKIVYNKIFTN